MLHVECKDNVQLIGTSDVHVCNDAQWTWTCIGPRKAWWDAKIGNIGFENKGGSQLTKFLSDLPVLAVCPHKTFRGR